MGSLKLREVCEFGILEFWIFQISRSLKNFEKLKSGSFGIWIIGKFEISRSFGNWNFGILGFSNSEKFGEFWKIEFGEFLDLDN